MIEYIGKTANATCCWEVDGKELYLPYRKNISMEETAQKLSEYRKILCGKEYKYSNDGLVRMFHFFGGMAFIRVGLLYKKEFTECFSHYADLFAQSWKNGTKRINSKEIGYKYVFEKMLSDEGDSCKYNFQYILSEVANSHIFCELTEKSFQKLWVMQILALISEKKSLSPVCYRIGVVHTCKYMSMCSEIEKYLRYTAEAFTGRREKISFTRLQECVFGKGLRIDYEVCGMRKLMKAVFTDEVRKQYRLFPLENRKELQTDKSTWVLYMANGMELMSLTMNFSEILNTGLRSEIRSFLKNRFTGHIRKKDNAFADLKRAANILTANNPNIHFFSDVAMTDVKMLQNSLEVAETTQIMIVYTFSACREAVDYLCGTERDKELKAPVPSENVFRKLRFVNSSRYSENTPYIPESVMNQLIRHTDKLSETDSLVFRILNETGMRAKEVSLLYADCLDEARYDGWVQLKYVPYKTLKARRRSGAGDRHSVYIPENLAEDIRRMSLKTAELRNEYKLPYLFLNKKEGRKSSILNMQGFSARINQLIKECGICDSFGELWHYTTRQCRKTLVVNMIENGATTEDIVYQLGHLNSTTAKKYYAEVRSIRMAEMNSDFFREKFETVVSEQQLESFSDEERRQLYVDFRLGLRRVELGYCIKRLCGSHCGNAASMYHCVSCPELCTGRKYLSYWTQLWQDGEKELKQLTEMYESRKISDYADFAEYKRIKVLNSAYGDIVSKLAADGETYEK